MYFCLIWLLLGLGSSYLIAFSKFHKRTFALSYTVMCGRFLLEADSSLNGYKEGVYLGEMEKVADREECRDQRLWLGCTV